MGGRSAVSGWLDPATTTGRTVGTRQAIDEEWCLARRFPDPGALVNAERCSWENRGSGPGTM